MIAALRLDLVGPEPGSAHARERLPLQPSRWYLTGFLVPYEGGEEQRSDFAAQDELDVAGDDDAHGDDAAVPEQASQRKAFLPSSLGVSVLVPEHATSLTIAVDWGITFASAAATTRSPTSRRQRACGSANRVTSLSW